MINEALRILAKYPKSPEEDDPRFFPTISYQKYNAHLNENAQLGVETVFDHAITGEERIRLGLPTHEMYLEIFEGDTTSVNAHLSVLAYIRGNLDARAEYIKRLPGDKLNEVIKIIMRLNSKNIDMFYLKVKHFS